MGGMRVKRFLLTSLLLLAVIFCACSSSSRAPLALFDAAFEAEVEGEASGASFAGKLTVSKASEDGARTATFTFYAPSAIAGTCVMRDESGDVWLSAGEVTVSAPQAYACLLDLFLFDEVAHVSRSDTGVSVTGETFSLEFATDGTPRSLERGDIRVHVLSFSQK